MSNERAEGCDCNHAPCIHDMERARAEGKAEGAREEREACARLVQSFAPRSGWPSDLLRTIESAIRARKSEEG